MKTYGVCGVQTPLTDAYHYDCLIKDSVLGESISFSVRKLSVFGFRYFIVLYCSIIFLSSYVFGNYRGHGEACSVISSYAVLSQDRYSYLITQISNSLGVV